MNIRNFVFAVKIFRIASVKKMNGKHAKEKTGRGCARTLRLY